MAGRLLLAAVVGSWLVAGGRHVDQRAQALTFEPLAGSWRTSTEDGHLVMTTDGKSPATVFPIAAAREIRDVRSARLAAEFRLMSGASDHTAGIVFGLAADGTYHFGRYNTKDGNVALWTFANGARTVLAHGEAHQQLATNAWHDISVTIREQTVTVSAAKGALQATHMFPAPIRGRIGFWTKGDSVTSFRRLSVEALR
jgi:hypothetical protein